MKKYNQLVYISNVIFLILLSVSLINHSISTYYSFSYMISILCFVMMGINIIMSIINFVKKQFKLAIIGMIVPVILFFGYMSPEGSDFSIFIVANIISLIISIINLFLSSDLEQTNNSKVPLIIFCIFNSVILFIMLAPMIMNCINIKNIKKVISNIDENSDIETYISEEAEEYIFYNKRGKEINRVNKNLYGRIYTISSQNGNKNKLMACVVGVNGSKLVLGITEKGVIINPKGERLMKLYNILGDNFSDYISFLNYIVVDQKMVTNERYLLIKDWLEIFLNLWIFKIKNAIITIVWIYLGGN